MSHVNTGKMVASTTGAGMAKMMAPTAGKLGMASMMSEGMGAMMKNPGVTAGAMASAGTSAGKSVIKKILTHPLALFGLGIVVGCYVYKNRQSILSASDEAQQ